MTTIIVIHVGRVVVVLAVCRLLQHFVIFLAEKSVFPESELVARNQMSLAGATTKALDVVDLRFGSHHEVGFAETQSALVALRPEQPAPTRAQQHHKMRDRWIQKHVTTSRNIAVANSTEMSPFFGS
jgi:hypothetical protein